MSDLSTEIYIVTHDSNIIKEVRNDETYTPLLVGCNGKENFGFFSDDSYEGNISKKNPYYCELTGLHWMWKESKADVIGLVHYRRYLKSKNGGILEKDEILDILSEYDIIIPKRVDLIKNTYWENFEGHFIYDSLVLTRDIIKELSPDYLKTFDEVMGQSSFSNFNMFISKRETILGYCEWVFPILEELERRIDLDESPRVFGFVTEAIFNVWIEHNKLKAKELPIYYVGNKLKARMFISEIGFLRKMYSFTYSHFLKSPRGQKIEEKVVEFFYSLFL